MQALQAAIALSQTVSVDSDTSKILEAGADRPGGQLQRRGRKQSKPLRGLDLATGKDVLGCRTLTLHAPVPISAAKPGSSGAVNAHRHSC